MGKRKRSNRDYDDYDIKKKIRRLERRLRRRSYSSESDEESYQRSRYASIPPERTPSPSYDLVDLSEADTDINTGPTVTASVTPSIPTASSSAVSAEQASSNVAPVEPASSSAAPVEPAPLPANILEAIGDPQGKDEVFGPKIQDEISKRWGRILVDGLTKEQKQDLMDKTLVPDNFRLVKAPLLNPEISPILGEAVRNRDKLLEKAQNHLGTGIAGLTHLATTIIEGNPDKIDILKRLSEVSQIFLDLHYENTKTRRKLVISSLDKKFTSTIQDVKRDSYLFGSNLGEKIKATKTAEKSGLQIKRSDGITGAASTSRKYPQGNWKGPPRHQAPRGHRQGGAGRRPYAQHSKRQPQADRFPPPSKTTNKPRKNP